MSTMTSVPAVSSDPHAAYTGILRPGTENAVNYTPVDGDLIELVLKPYHDNCRYLKQAFYDDNTKNLAPDQAPELHARFAIDNSCYIDSTGHFNAVESNICANQIGYLAIAWFLKQKFQHPYWDAMGDFDLSQFRRKQLPNILILNINTSFRRAIDPSEYYGRLKWYRTRQKKSLSLLNMAFSFFDRFDGRAEGEMLVAIT